MLTRLTLVAAVAFAIPLAHGAALPSYVLTYAPYTYLNSGEKYWPSDITTHFQHVTPKVNRMNVALSVNVASLSSFGNDVFLTSKDDVTDADQPTEDWLLSNYGKPSSEGASSAPATIIAVQKDNGIVDAFYFHFYSWDLGNTAIGIRFGNHVGDWEHVMVRFQNGSPTHVYLSAHSSGSAYTYAALPKQGQRPITYIASGTHANYATAADQKYPIPIIGPITDKTNQGVAWDVTKNFRGYWYDKGANTFTVAGGAGSGGTAQSSGEGASWLSYQGKWGDDLPPVDILNNQQYCISTECHYVAGPTGPIAKNLGRAAVCQTESDCSIRTSAKAVSLGATFDADVAKLSVQLKELESRGGLNNVTNT